MDVRGIGIPVPIYLMPETFSGQVNAFSGQIRTFTMQPEGSSVPKTFHADLRTYAGQLAAFPT